MPRQKTCACGLKERYAQQLVKAAEWVNAQHVAHINTITDTAALFLLSADAPRVPVPGRAGETVRLDAVHNFIENALAKITQRCRHD